jgi:hypothetical protein
LQSAGFKDVKVVAESFVVQAKSRESPVKNSEAIDAWP